MKWLRCNYHLEIMKIFMNLQGFSKHLRQKRVKGKNNNNKKKIRMNLIKMKMNKGKLKYIGDLMKEN